MATRTSPYTCCCGGPTGQHMAVCRRTQASGEGGEGKKVQRAATQAAMHGQFSRHKCQQRWSGARTGRGRMTAGHMLCMLAFASSRDRAARHLQALGMLLILDFVHLDDICQIKVWQALSLTRPSPLIDPTLSATVSIITATHLRVVLTRWG
eukprot:328037-Pelagomonas_calceolata.AAC.2